MARIIIGPHISACIKPNNSFDLSLFLVNGVLIILRNKQALQVSYDS